jgi:hypothetical protein
MTSRVPARRPNPRLANPIYERDARTGKFIVMKNGAARDTTTVRGEPLPPQNKRK